LHTHVSDGNTGRISVAASGREEQGAAELRFHGEQGHSVVGESLPPHDPRNRRDCGLAATLEALRFGQRREDLERVVLDLADPFAGDAEGAADLFERPRLTAI
jgi:hypothetical protein